LWGLQKSRWTELKRGGKINGGEKDRQAQKKKKTMWWGKRRNEYEDPNQITDFRKFAGKRRGRNFFRNNAAPGLNKVCVRPPAVCLGLQTDKKNKPCTTAGTKTADVKTSRKTTPAIARWCGGGCRGVKRGGPPPPNVAQEMGGLQGQQPPRWPRIRRKRRPKAQKMGVRFQGKQRPIKTEEPAATLGKGPGEMGEL